jgi:DNA helicase-2/ATP-dependent DNA helicase PcrA
MTKTGTQSTHGMRGTTEEFEAAYARLNAEQREAVDTIDGPVFVIAGPGTGKTQILTLRMANILKLTDTPPEAILALTFTEAGVSTMRARLGKLIGARAQRVRIHTFHGFAESLIARYPDAFPRIVGGEIATDVERAEIFDHVLLNTEVQYLRPFGDPLYYHYMVSSAISNMKRENVTTRDLRARVETSEADFESTPDKFHAKGKYEGKLKGDYETLQKKIAKTRDLLAVYEAYEEELTKRKRYDFEDVILEAVRALTEDESFRREVQEAVFYVHADEHQDANRAQNALLELLVEAQERPNLFVVGDEKQAIYRFQGADLDNVHYFRERFPETKIIALIANYRSHQMILDSALSLIAASPDERLSRVQLLASGELQDETLKSKHAPVRRMQFAIMRRVECQIPVDEMEFLAKEIEGLTLNGVAPEEIAVLVRRNSDVSYVADALLERGIPVGRGTDNALQNRFVAVLLKLLGAVVEPRDENLGGLFTLPGFHLSGADVWRIMDIARREKMPALDILGNTRMLEEAKVQDAEKAVALRATLDDLTRLASLERPAVVAQAALAASGIMDAILMADDRIESLAAVRELLKSFEELSRREHDALLPRALVLVKLHEERGIPLTKAIDEMPGLVRVMTVHRAKGREFEYVYVPRLTDRAWSTRNRPEHFYVPDILSGAVELEDERRLLYVAMTRAKRACTLSYTTNREDGKAESPCILLEELDPKLVESVVLHTGDPEDIAITLQKQVTRARKLLNPVQETIPSKDDLETFNRAFLAQGLTPTALNNYLECAWKYFYISLLRIPGAENKHMLFGTAIHTALKSYADRRTRGDDVPEKYLIDEMNRALRRAPLAERELDELKEKGARALTAWWKEHQPSWPAKTESELSVQAFVTLADGTALDVHGKLDRMDPLPGGVYQVIDYKTGKIHSRNDLLGQTKNSDGNFYRQLQFYKLLLAKAEPSREMTTGIIEFVEPDESGKIRSEIFEITDVEVADLEALIQKSAQEILTLSFWNTPCDDDECQWCALRFTK